MVARIDLADREALYAAMEQDLRQPKVPKKHALCR
jgi:hypothetical protein